MDGNSIFFSFLNKFHKKGREFLKPLQNNWNMWVETDNWKASKEK